MHRPVDLRHLGVGVSKHGVENEEVLLVDVGPEGGLHQALQLSRAEGLDNGRQRVRVAAVQSCRIQNRWWLNFLFPSSYCILQFYTTHPSSYIYVGFIMTIFTKKNFITSCCSTAPPLFLKIGVHFCSPKRKKKKIPLNLLFPLAGNIRY